MGITVRNWEYHDGWRTTSLYYTEGPTITDRYFDEELVGWHCDVYTDDDEVLISWMENNMKGEYVCIFRFNSGNPMYTVHIKDSENAAFFKLKWL